MEPSTGGGGGPGQVQGRVRCHPGEPHGGGAAAGDREGVSV